MSPFQTILTTTTVFLPVRAAAQSGPAALLLAPAASLAAAPVIGCPLQAMKSTLRKIVIHR